MKSYRPIERRKRVAADARSGAAAVEFAFCLPVMLVITFGSIEASNSIFLKQIVTQAAYEGSRVATTIGATESEAKAFAQQILDSREISGATIDITPTINANTPSGTEVTVTVTAPSNSNAIAPLWYFADRSIQARVVMVRN